MRPASAGVKLAFARRDSLRRNAIRMPLAFAALASVLVLGACERQDPTASAEGVVEAAYAAIKANDWDAYSKLTVTSADFILKENNAQSQFKQKSSYVGSQLKPEEQRRQKQEFQRAVAGGEGQIDFQTHKFEKAHLAAQGNEELLNGSTIPVSAYLVAAEGQSAPSQEPPGFVVVPWGSFYKVLRLTFPDAGADEEVAAASEGETEEPSAESEE